MVSIMVRFIVKKILRVIVVLAGATLITFLLMHAIPGSPWDNYSSSPRLMMGLGYDEPLRRELNRRFGLDLPLWRQYTRYVIGDFDDDGSFSCGMVCGNLGPSIQQGGRGILDILFSSSAGLTFWESRFGYSVRLVILATLFVIGLGIPLGLLSATRPRSFLSRAISVSLAGLISIPNFVLGLLAILLLASWLKIISVLPNWDNPGHWIVPAFVLAALPMSSLARVTSTSMTSILKDDFVRTARAKGLSQNRVMLVHVLRNALLPIITFLGPALMEMFIGLFIVENLYGFPGLGREYWQAVLWLDYPMIMGLTLLYATGIVLVNILVEIVCAILDPRLRSPGPVRSL